MTQAVEVSATDAAIESEERWGAHNYHPLPVVVSHARGAWVYDIEGRRYLDCLSAYSAVNPGHCHPRILGALREQAERVTLTSRAFHNDQLPGFCRELAQLCGMEMVLPMNSGTEAVETGIKASRRWGYLRKGIPEGRAEIVVCENNFHGRSVTIVGFSSDPVSRAAFGPFTPGFRVVPYADAAALRAAITRNTCAFIVEPIQCEGGILIPPPGYLAEAAAICRERDVLLVADEIQTGFGRTGKLFACHHEDVQPDVYLLAKSLSGGFYPVSAVVSRREILGLFDTGSHGATFGGNPLGCAVAREAMRVIVEEGLIDRSARLGAWFLRRLRKIRHPAIVEVRGRGMLAGIELREPARPYCERLQRVGILCKETHERVIRLAPPLVTARSDLEWALERLRTVFAA